MVQIRAVQINRRCTRNREGRGREGRTRRKDEGGRRRTGHRAFEGQIGGGTKHDRTRIHAERRCGNGPAERHSIRTSFNQRDASTSGRKGNRVVVCVVRDVISER